MTDYFRPTRLEDALAIRAEHGDNLAVLAGGTDHYPARTHRQAWFDDRPKPVLDLTAIAGLSGIEHGEAGTRIGAATRWAALTKAALPPAFDGLRQASRQVGGLQIQNRATLAGNLCNASPAADGAPPLMALGARVELASLGGKRMLPLADFLLGNRRTALKPDEIMVALHVPPQPDGMRSTFLKLGARSYLVISIASVAAQIVAGPDGHVAEARFCVGACSAVPQRLPSLEARLAGRPLDAGLADLVTPEDCAALSPIDDVRATAAYRSEAALSLLRRAILDLAAPAVEQAA